MASRPVYGSEGARKSQLRGVNRSGAEYSCVQNDGIFEGPVDDNAIQNMKKWNINVVRIPLNEDCWLGVNAHNPDYSGPPYRQAVEAYVARLRNNRLQVILDLHWSAGVYTGPGGGCSDFTASCQKPMPDRQNAPAFWASVAGTFKNDTGVIFDIFNEPFPDMAISDSVQAWSCLRDGGSACPGFQYEVAGMQDLVDAVRSTGARNMIMSPGLTWTGDLSRWMEFVPEDPASNIAASWHNYNTGCDTQHCWASHVGGIVGKYPIIVGEFGENDCSYSYIDQLYCLGWIGGTLVTWDGRGTLGTVQTPL